MPSLKDIRNRIQSTKNMRQITSALKLVSASKLKRAQANAVNLRPYAKGLMQLTLDLVQSQRVDHPLIKKREKINNVLLVVISSDRGLCGSFNSTINKFTAKYVAENQSNYQKIDFVFVGRKSRDFFLRRGIKPRDMVTDLAREISYGKATEVANKILELYSSGEYDEVRVIYNEFKSAIAQEVRCEKLLPMDPADARRILNIPDGQVTTKDIIIEPAPEVIIGQLLEKYFTVQIYKTMSESVASEHGARMTAMENATKNAGEQIKILTLNYNKLRQASITSELIEITTGAESLKSQ
ncbi:MAG: ATP synthase F1 subunit gamma [Bdellovibrionales bacterium]|nr:ATP synthase F1 subunit gamma [Bdellovibrionales bacterium]